MSNLIFKIHHAVDMVRDRLVQEQGEIGLQFVGAYNEKRIPKYPAAVIIPGPLDKEIHSTHTFEIAIALDVYIYHANLTLTKRERSREELLLVDKTEEVLESDYTWLSDPNDVSTARVIFGYVSEVRPLTIQPQANKSDMVIGTRLSWRGLSQRRFRPDES